MLNRPKPLVLPMLDSFGCSLGQENNAIAMAKTPCWGCLQKDYLVILFMPAILGIPKSIETSGKSLLQTA
ncbi:MAG: hypothetical protein ACXW1W_10185 [Methylococcaceae bacterium]